MSTRKRKKKKHFAIRIILPIILLAISGFFIYNVFRDGVTTYTLTVEINDAKKELNELQQENAHLVSQKEKLEDENYIKNYARGEYMITKNGEQIFHLPTETTTEE